MKPHKPFHEESRIRLTRRDLIRYENLLRDSLSRVIPFKSYSLFFPRTPLRPEAVWESQDKKLLVPLILHGELLGVFVARGIGGRPAKTLLASYPAVATLCLENLLLYKMSITDPSTGLSSLPHMLSVASREVGLIRECFRLGADSRCDVSTLGHRACMGLVVLRFSSMPAVVRDCGYLFAEQLCALLADELQTVVPEQAFAARTGDNEMAVFLPTATPRVCRKVAGEAVRKLRAVSLQHELRDEDISVTVAAGYANYPQDMNGAQFERPEAEQARLLLRKARTAASIAVEKVTGSVQYVMGFGRILAEGGKVQEVLPMNRAVISLGAAMDAREGQRFSIWSPVQHSGAGQNRADASAARGSGEKPSAPSVDPCVPPLPTGTNAERTLMYKGELVLMEVRENTSLAEIMHLGDPAWGIEAGDTLTLLPEDKGVSASDAAKDSQGVGGADPLTGLLRHRDFLSRWTRDRDNCSNYTLALMRLTGESRLHEGRSAHAEQLMAQAAEACRDHLSEVLPKGESVASFGGRYGLNSLIHFHPDVPVEDVYECYVGLCEHLERKLHIEAAVGIARHPFLNFRKPDSLENSLKALEYAMLMEKPRVGVIDTWALNISADKLFSQGDTFAAIDEYKLALLADETNTMAWNSLGVCMAGLGKHSEARRLFGEALGHDKRDVMTLYNLGHVCQNMGDFEDARQYYRKCLKYEKEHVFALLRLGQLAEMEKKFGPARQYYNRAAKLDGAQALTWRYLARLCMRQGRPDEAREHLHQALIYNPQDAMSLQLLARLYLDGGDDPEVAAVLARQAVALRPELKVGWLDLARALEATGRQREASEALSRAAEL
ncbi:tetratricopeptide repeat protein [Oleidesulfovibrio sp.]|uniref:tetratricopeptide repeat-containing diguanylate cyclase n=1 Tax=Oleidesulfovibrio sp. TaxID=2909707 RepID=UPI003A889934